MDEKLTKCPECGAEDYDSYRVSPEVGDSSKTYCVCNHCDTEFDGVVSWE